MTLSNIKKICREIICLFYFPLPSVPFSLGSCTGCSSLVYLFALGCHSSTCRHPSMPFMCLPVKIPWGHSSVNLTIYPHYIPGYFSPVCPDTCQDVSHLSDYSIYISKCHSLPWFKPFRQLFLSD
ncbi:uncharacterized [Lates japonicus]